MNETTNNAVDFTNPESIDAAMSAAETEAALTPAKPKKERKPRTINVTFTADRDIMQGEEITFPYTIPLSARARGVNVGIPLEEMDEAQLKIEYRNANSVLYKTKKAGRDTTNAQARFDKVVARMHELGVAPTARSTTPAAPVTAATVVELIKSGKISTKDIEDLLNA